MHQARAHVESLTKHQDMSNRVGICALCSMTKPVSGTIEYLLLFGGYPALVKARLSMIFLIQAYLVPRPYLLPILAQAMGVPVGRCLGGRLATMNDIFFSFFSVIYFSHRRNAHIKTLVQPKRTGGHFVTPIGHFSFGF